MIYNDLFSTGIRPAIDAYLLEKAAEIRDYGPYWSASSAGYCMRKIVFDRLKIPSVSEDARKQRIFSAGHIFHAWIQDITANAGVSQTQEAELINNTLMVKGHYDDIVVVDGKEILYDYKTQNSRAFTWQKDKPMSYLHHMQLGTYLYMLRANGSSVSEARILKISKDDLRMKEEQLLWSPTLEKEITDFWRTLNDFWKKKTIPLCTCAEKEGGFMAKEKYNPYYYNGEPCSIAWLEKCKQEGKVNGL